MCELKGKRLKFVNEYMIDLNGTAAAIKAGYSAKTAAAQASRLINKDPAVKAEIARRKEELNKAKTAEADEVIEFYTAVMRGEIPDHIPLGIGKGLEELVEVKPMIKDRLKAAAELGKMYGLDRFKEDDSKDDTGGIVILAEVKNE